ncbi:putative ABC transport system permease protein [Kitasatospora sp. MAA4]|uniref:FtsX-like permease family protein n=1 Tax=Kitasatospora sp. MAA4 TaxID=3035093 RepID=UPI002475EDC0|nr:FtsX-like permease family protein [Kitasatospora sp. MAA4]MDH6135114.1 putative ABC transport system permease protein [Kitasatospora sp. MAA4]
MKLSAWRVALRIARRDALRAKGRSALVLAMIALPVLGVTGADVVYHSATLTPAETATRTLGRADALINQLAPGLTVLQAPDPNNGTSADPRQTGPKSPEQQRSASTDPATLVKELLPAGAVLTPVPYVPSVLASTVDGLTPADTDEADLTDPVWKGRINLVKGRAPAASGEVAATQAFLDASGLSVGSTTTLRGVSDKPFTITGVAEYPNELKRSRVVGRPGELSPAAKADGQAPARADRWLVRMPAGAALDWAKVQELNKYSFTVASRAVLLNPPPRSAVPYYVQEDQHAFGGSTFDQTSMVILGTVVGMALLEIVLLAGPAFAVGARRSRRQLGLIGAGGGDRSHIRSVVLSGGVVLGLAGAAVGVVLAVLLVAVTRPWTEELAGQRFGHLSVQPLDLLGIAAIGLVTGLLAAVVPAVQASRQDVVAALTGRGAVKPPSRKLTVLGVLMLAGGAALALLGAAGGPSGRMLAVLGGSMVAELGMVACTPMIVGLFGGIGRWLPLAPRLALRDSIRHRGRTAPAVAAVMAAVAGSVAVGIYSASSDQESRQAYVASAPRGAVTLAAGYGVGGGGDLIVAQRNAVERSMTDLGPRADVLSVDYHGNCHVSGSNCGQLELEVAPDQRCPAAGDSPYIPYSARNSTDPRCNSRVSDYGSNFGSIIAGDATVLHNLFGLHDQGAEQAVAQGKVLVFDARFVKDGKVTFKLTDPYARPTGGMPSSGQAPEPPSHEVTADAVLVPMATPAAQAFLPPATATALGLTTSDGGSAWLPASMPSSGAEQRATAAVAKSGGDHWNFQIERGFRPTHTLIVLGLTAFAALVALGAAGIATGLASADSQQDLTTLAAIGAAPRIRRTLSGLQCGVIAAMGAVLGTICGVVPAVALRKVVAMTGFQQPAHAVIAFPWLTMGLTLVGLPVLAAVLAALLTRSKITLLRRAG